jgi:hypothetical protein
MPKNPSKLGNLQGVVADRSVIALEARTFIDPERMPDGPQATGQSSWSSLKQRQKGEVVLTKSSYTADEVSDIVKNAVAEVLKAVSGFEKESTKEKREVGDIKIGGK